MASTKLTWFIIRLLRYLISLAGRSIKDLITLVGLTRRFLTRNRDKPFRDYPHVPSDNEDTESPLNTPSDVLRKEHLVMDVPHEAKPSEGPDRLPSHPPSESTLLRSNNEYICPSFPPRLEHVKLDIRPHDDNDGPSTTRSASPRPSRPTSTPSRPPPSPPIAAPIGDSPSRSSTTDNGLDIMPMSTASVQRWDRGVVV